MGSQIIETTFLLKRGSAKRWAEVNPVLKQGEPGFVYDSNQLKIGDGKTPWNELPFIEGSDTTITLTPVNGSLIIKDNTIDIGISIDPGNTLIKKPDGLFVPATASNNYDAGSGLTLVDGTFSVKLKDETNGLVAVDGALTINLATKDSAGAMSKEDKAFIDAIPDVYIERKYEVFHKPANTLVDYREKEIRIMCPSTTNWHEQTHGQGGDMDASYIGFRAYAPASAVSFKEDLAEIITDSTMHYFDDTKVAGIDNVGRKYSIMWLPVAKLIDNSWNYFGKSSTESKYTGWYYTVEWYNDTKLIDTETIRINLSNENCHNNIKSFYGAENDVYTEITSVKETVSEIE